MGKETLKLLDPFINYSIGKANGWNPRSPYGYFTQAGIAARRREQQEKRDAEQLAVNQAAIAAPKQRSNIYVNSGPSYQSSLTNYSTTVDDYWQGSQDTSYSYSGGSTSRSGPFHAQWWLDTGVFSAWEDFGGMLAYPGWGMRIGFGLAAAFIALMTALANSWPGVGTLIAVLVGGIAGMIAPVLLGRSILILREIAGGGLAVLTWLALIAVVALAVVLGVRAFSSKPAAAIRPTVSYSDHTQLPAQHLHRKGSKVHKSRNPTIDWSKYPPIPAR